MNYKNNLLALQMQNNHFKIKNIQFCCNPANISLTLCCTPGKKAYSTRPMGKTVRRIVPTALDRNKVSPIIIV